MNHLLDHDLDHDLDQAEAAQDREISLGPGTILGLFFGLALLCGAVFGLGYSMGRHSAQNAPAAVIIGDGSAAALPSAAKPTGYTAPAPEEESAPQASPVSTHSSAAPADATIAGDKLPKAAAAPLPQPAASGAFMVQVAAVSTQEIADIELAALRKFGYQVVIRHEPTDQLLHIQIGPFATKKEAEAMRQNVLSHGFNAIVK